MTCDHHGLVGIGANIDCPGVSQLVTRSVIVHTRQGKRYEHVVTVRPIHFSGSLHARLTSLGPPR